MLLILKEISATSFLQKTDTNIYCQLSHFQFLKYFKIIKYLHENELFSFIHKSVLDSNTFKNCRLAVDINTMSCPSNQDDDNIVAISERIQTNNGYDITDPEVKQAVFSHLRRQYPDLRMAGKKIRVLSSQGDEITDPSRLKITSITRIVRGFNPEVVARSSQDKENRPPGTPDQSHKRLRSTSSLSFLSISPDKEGGSILSSDRRQDQARPSLPSSLQDLFTISSDEDEDGMTERSCGECLGSNNNNISQSKNPEAELDIEPRTSSEDPDKYFPLDMIKKMLIDTKVSSESFMRSCRSLEKEWFRLDGNWNAEISSSALRMVLGKDLTDKILDSISSPSHCNVVRCEA